MPELAKCPECGKLYAPHAERDRCGACLLKQDYVQGRIEDALRHVKEPTLAAIAHYTGYDKGIVQRAIEQSRVLRAQVDLGEPCAHCGKRGAQAGSKYCFPCRLALFNELGDAVEAIAPHLERVHQELNSANPSLGLGRALEEKRSRTRSARINLGPDTRVKP